MPRTKKNVTPEERLLQITKEMEDTRRLLGELKEQKKELEEQIRQAQLERLYNMIQESGRSLEDVQAILTQ